MVSVLGFWITARQQLQSLREVLGKYSSDEKIHGQDRHFIVGNLWVFGRECHRFELRTALVPLRYIIGVPDFDKAFSPEPLTNQPIRAGETLLRLNQFEENFHHDAMLRFILLIPEDRINYLDGALSRRFKTAFPSAIEDLDEAGNCYAAGRHRATVFHAIRAAEWALKTLAKSAGVEGPLDYREWGNIIAKIEQEVAGVDKWQRGPEKANALAFYRGALADARSINNVWRTSNLHARSGVTCGKQDALRILDLVIEFMSRISTRVSEQQKRRLSKRSFSK